MNEKIMQDIFDVMLDDTSIRLKMYEMIIEYLYNETLKLKTETKAELERIVKENEQIIKELKELKEERESFDECEKTKTNSRLI